MAGATPGSGTIYAADIGDNALARTEIQLYRVAEPAVPTTGPAVTEALGGVETLHLTYPDGPHDAETFMIDPSTGDLVVVTKLLTGGTVGVYRAAGPLAAGSTTQLTKVADLTYPSGLANAVTGGDVAADGSAVVIRTYGAVRRLQPRQGHHALERVHRRRRARRRCRRRSRARRSGSTPLPPRSPP